MTVHRRLHRSDGVLNSRQPRPHRLKQAGRPREGAGAETGHPRGSSATFAARHHQCTGLDGSRPIAGGARDLLAREDAVGLDTTCGIRAFPFAEEVTASSSTGTRYLFVVEQNRDAQLRHLLIVERLKRRPGPRSTRSSVLPRLLHFGMTRSDEPPSVKQLDRIRCWTEDSRRRRRRRSRRRSPRKE